MQTLELSLSNGTATSRFLELANQSHSYTFPLTSLTDVASLICFVLTFSSISAFLFISSFLAMMFDDI